MTVAFFDLDETVITGKSMFTFLEYYLTQTRKRHAPTYAMVMTSIYTKVTAGASRADINRYYYSLFKGCRQDDIREHAKACFTADTIDFHNAVVERLNAHRARGDTVVFVSGAMRDIIYPIADMLAVDAFLCSEPEVAAGVYTGKLTQQAIGTGKARLIEAYCQAQGIDPDTCTAYGDHLSDQHMLNHVGRAVAVYPQQDLRALAMARNWEVIG